METVDVQSLAERDLVNRLESHQISQKGYLLIFGSELQLQHVKGVKMDE